MKSQTCSSTGFVWLVKGDTRPILEFVCKINGSVLDLSGCTVYFIFRQVGARTYKFKRQCTITNPVEGKCVFYLISGDLDTVGDFNGELEVHFPDNTVQTSKLIHFKVRDQLG